MHHKVLSLIFPPLTRGHRSSVRCPLGGAPSSGWILSSVAFSAWRRLQCPGAAFPTGRSSESPPGCGSARSRGRLRDVSQRPLLLAQAGQRRQLRELLCPAASRLTQQRFNQWLLSFHAGPVRWSEPCSGLCAPTARLWLHHCFFMGGGGITGD